MGISTEPFDVRIVNSLNATLKVECMQGSTLVLRNAGGRCLQIWHPNSQRIEVRGNRTVEIILSTAMPQTIDVSGMTSWGAPGRRPANTRVLLHVSRWQTDGNNLVNGSTSVVGELPYTVFPGAYGVIISYVCWVLGLTYALGTHFTYALTPLTTHTQGLRRAKDTMPGDRCNRPQRVSPYQHMCAHGTGSTAI